MANINELLARAAALRDETQLNSISPERAGGIMYETLLALNELWLQQGAALVISKIYASVAAMEADTAPVSDLTGLPLRPGQIVVIASSDSDNGSVYRYNGTSSPSWSLVGEIGNLDPVDSLDSDSTSLPLAAHQGKVLDGKISQLGQHIENSEWVRVVTDNENKILYGVKTDGKFYFGADCPPQVQEYVTNNFVMKVAGKSLIDADFASSQEFTENAEWMWAVTDSEGKVICGIKKDGTIVGNTAINANEINLSEQGLASLKEDLALNTDDDDILVQYPEAQLLPKLLNTTKINHNGARKDVLSLIHFSDVHGYWPNMSVITRFMSKYGDHITDVIHSGDTMQMDLTGTMMPEFENSWLNCIGNHDATIFDGNVYVLQPSLSAYNKVFKDYISHWNVIQPGDVSDDNYDISTSYPTYAATNGLCYYYKDYASHKVRMIVVDDNYVEGSSYNHWNAAQKTWFELALNQTLDENSSAYGYHVIVVVHHPPFLIKTDKDNMFQSYDGGIGTAVVAPPEIGKCVNDFIEAGGIFVCWLSGHLHKDYNGFGLGGDTPIYGYPNQFVINITGSLSPNNLAKYEKSVRVANTKSQYGMNIIGIDTDNKIIKVLRMGTDIDMFMRRKESFSCSYALDAQHQLVTGIITQN